MKTVILGAGNLLISDEGLGVHFIEQLQSRYTFGPEVELVDAGTFGLLAVQYAEEADLLYIIDALAVDAEPGEIRRYTGEDLRLERVPAKLSPHQLGLRDMLAMAEIRGLIPAEVHVFGVVPESLETGDELTATCREALERVEGQLIADLLERNIAVNKN